MESLNVAKQRCTTFFYEHHLVCGAHNDTLLEETLTHRSYAADYPAKKIPYNERLEFLGDALLGAVIAQLLWEEYPDMTEADLTLKKIYLIKEPTLATVARHVGLGNWLRLGKGEEKSGGRKKDTILADACEARIAYLWRQFGQEAVTKFVEIYIYPLRTDREAMRGKSYKSLLQERVQKAYQQLPVYVEEIAESESSGNVLLYRSSVSIQDRIIAEAVASNKKKAQEEAARLAYEELLMKT